MTLATGKEVSYRYDTDGVRIRTEASASDGATAVTSYLVDSQGPLPQVVAETDSEGNLRAYYSRGDGLLAVLRSSTARYYHTDGLGSVRLLTDEEADVADRYTFTAIGELIDREGEDPNSYLFAGESADPITSLYYLRARWMDPETGRFASADPFPGVPTDPRSLHRYTYTGNDPVNRTDPTGMFHGALSG